MTKKYWCPMCGEVPATPTMGIALLVMHKADCIGFHAIPVVEPLAVPEVTTLDKSDLVDGMVVTVCDVMLGHTTLCTPDATLLDDGYAWAHRLTQIWLTDDDSVRYVAGVRR